MKNNLYAFVFAMMIPVMFSAQNIVVEIDAVHNGMYMSSQGEVDLTGYATFSVWATVPDGNDCVVSLAGGLNDAPNDLNCGNDEDTDNLGIMFSGEVFNEPLCGAFGGNIQCLLAEMYPAMWYDSYLTFGAECASDESTILSVSLPCESSSLFDVFHAADATDMFHTGSLIVDNGAVFALPGGTDSNTFPDENLRVKVGQFTTNGGFCLYGWVAYQPDCQSGNNIISTQFNQCHEMPCDAFTDDLAYSLVPEGNGETFSLNISGGNGTLSIELFNYMDEPVGSGGSAIGGLAPGNYYLLVSNDYGCSYTIDNIIIEGIEPLVIQMMAEDDDATCESGIGNHIEMEITGGVAPYTVQVNGIEAGVSVKYIVLGEDAPDINYLSVTDSEGNTFYMEVGDPQATNTLISSTTTDPTCNGDNNGEIELDADAFTTVNWNNGISGYALHDIPAGTYFYLATDNTGCAVYDGTTLNNFAPMQVAAAIENVSCNGFNNGAVNLSLSGGTGQYEIDFNGADPQMLAPGNYPFTVTDSNGCTLQNEVDITEPDALEYTITNFLHESATDAYDGSITIELAGGTPPYSVQWSNGVSGYICDGLTASPYSFYALDANGCMIEGTVQMMVGVSEALQPSILLSYQLVNHSVLTTVPHSGHYIITIFDSNGRIVLHEDFSTTTHNTYIGHLAAGMYHVRVTDGNAVETLQFVRE